MSPRALRDEDAPPYDGEARPRGVEIISEAPRFAQLWDAVLFDPDLSASAKTLYAVLQRYSLVYGAGSIYPTQETMAEDAFMNRETVGKALAALEQRGHIRRESRGFGETRRIVLCPPQGVGNDGIPSCRKNRQMMPEKPTTYVGKTDTITDTKDTDTRTDTNGSGFAAFLKAYGPTNGPTPPARNAWNKLSRANQQLAMENLPYWLASEGWQNGYKPYPQKYLNQEIYKKRPVATPRREARGFVSQADLNRGGTGKVVL